MLERARRGRGVSPVVGVVLLVGIVVATAAVSGAMVMALSEEREPAPEVALTLEPGDNTAEYVLVHESGAVVDGDAVELRGVADPEGLAGDALSAGNRHRVYATDGTVRVVWFGDDDTSYVLREFEVDGATVPDPDEGCAWVDTETNGGTEDAKVDAFVVDCDVETAKVSRVDNGGAVIGDLRSSGTDVRVNDGTVYGDADAEDVANLQAALVTGDAVSRTADVKLDDAEVRGSVSAAKVAEAINGSTVEGDLVGDTLAKVLSSDVSGAVVSEDEVKLDGATVGGHVYVDEANFDCTDSTIAGADCGEYTPQDPDDY